MRGRAALLISRGASERAFEDLDEVFRIDQQEPEGRVLRIRALLAEDDLTQARQSLSSALAHAPGDARLFALRSRLKLASQDIYGAQLDCNEAGRLDQHCAEAYFTSALLRQQADQDEAASIDYQAARRLAPERLDILGHQIVLFHKMKSWSEANDAHTAALALGAKDALCYLGRARARHELGELQGALDDLNEAIARSDGQAESYFERAAVRRKLLEAHGITSGDPRWRLVISDLATAIELRPDFAEALGERAALALRQL